jgi:hypothetical protein
MTSLTHGDGLGENGWLDSVVANRARFPLALCFFLIRDLTP